MEDSGMHSTDFYCNQINQALTCIDRVVPRTVKALRQTPMLQEISRQGQEIAWAEETEQVWGIFFRYVEYCITAPLLFLAVVCLLIVDAPAW